MTEAVTSAQDGALTLKVTFMAIILAAVGIGAGAKLKHDFEPTEGVYWPSGHLVQSDAPTSEKVPTLQLAHAPRPELAYIPAVQAVQLEAPVAL